MGGRGLLWVAEKTSPAAMVGNDDVSGARAPEADIRRCVFRTCTKMLLVKIINTLTGHQSSDRGFTMSNKITKLQISLNGFID